MISGPFKIRYCETTREVINFSDDVPQDLIDLINNCGNQPKFASGKRGKFYVRTVNKNTGDLMILGGRQIVTRNLAYRVEER